MEHENETLAQVGGIEGGLVFNGSTFVAARVAVEGGVFGELQEVGEGGEAAGREPARGNADGAVVVDATGGYVIPGLVDIHFHGCMGADLCDGTPEALSTIAAHEASRGVTAVCPASMTFPTDVLEAAFANAAAFAPSTCEAALVGINMEGPYISPSKVGAQNPAYVRTCDASEFEHLQKAADGLIKLVDVAPEEPGALAFIDEVSGQVGVSLAHTCADYACAAEAFERGARYLTHLFNVMPGLHHRLPGPIAAGAERDQVTAELIADGVHVHPAMVRLAFSLFGADRIALISDSMRACGLTDGTYDLGGQDVTVAGPRATLADGTIAGSVTDLMGCLACAVQEMEIPLEDAVRAATIVPARAIGVDDERGSIEAGKVADAVVLNADLTVRHVVLRGKLLR